ncbi:NAD(P)H-binding protein [Actinokineospora auranticolor]|uniref:Uncharacterized protein YbjT (DUF2867 family) n=1 Tax=Actinokineospora auranticolor TaxID=155976 RepID=A0A2S6GDG4_9PSEU|nr:NAD(P)H-binding protein [Actinokineospora auranticolor]PPK63273.1 uncharacterized protein YbjT (DUF2867 family) [Actinokineospora auranticolor]
MGIHVIGATGKTGRRVVERLTAAGHDATGLSRPAFDWQEPATWAPALTGVDALYLTYYPDLAVPGAPEAIREVVAIAVEQGARRIVLLSGRGEHNAQVCEEIVAASGVEHTLLRASWFAQNFTEGHLRDFVQHGAIALPAGPVAEPFIDAGDIADVAVAALTGDGHAGRLYELTGPRLLTFAEAAAEISAAAGKPVAYHPLSLEDFRAMMVDAVGEASAELLTNLCAEVLDGRNASLGTGVRDALGREPRDFADFCRAADWAA